MRQFSTPSQHHQKFLSPGSGGGPGSRRGSGSGGIGGGGGGGSAAPMPLASSSQSRFKGIVPSPGVVKFSQWKRENEIPKRHFHEYVLSKIREHDPNKIWLRDYSKGRVETFGRVSKSVSTIASGLTKIGMSRGDVVCMFCSNYVEYWLLTLAVWSCGGCVMPVNCEMEAAALQHQIVDAGAKFLVCDDYNVEDAIDLMKELDILNHVIVMGVEGKAQGCIPISDLSDDDGKCPPRKPNLDLEHEVIYLPFTSSSSGEPRGIMHTSRSMLSCFFSPDNAANHYIDQMVGDSLACGNWFFHMSGLYPVILAAIYGVSVYCLSDYSDHSFLEMIMDTKTATATLYPWQVRLLSQSPLVAKYNLSHLKSIITGGGVLSATIRMELMDRFPSVKFVREAFGLNECGFVTLTYPREKKNSLTAAKVLELPDDHVMPVGLPNMYTQIKITNRQSGDPVGGPEEQGEICVRSPQNFVGYLHCPDNKTLFDPEGFFRTGDLGFYDSNGVINFVERIDNLIHFWMYEVAPTILESRLLGSNNIVDAAVVGIPNKENGEVPRAFVVLRPGFEETEENLANLMETRLQDHERIRGGLFFVQSIPRDENWKVLKDILKNYEPVSSEEASYKEADSTTMPTTLAKAKKTVKVLEKQPNGSFMVSASAEEHSSPRTKRAANRKTQDQQDTYEVGPLEDTSRLVSAPGRGGGRRASVTEPPQPVLVGSGGVAGSQAGAGAGTFSYWMRVRVCPPVLESVILSHPAVSDCAVHGFAVPGIGHLPRAYVVLKNGYEATSEDLTNFVSARVADTDRLRGGVVFLDKLAKDPNGKLIINLDKFDKHAQMVDKEFIKNQPKVKV